MLFRPCTEGPRVRRSRLPKGIVGKPPAEALSVSHHDRSVVPKSLKNSGNCYVTIERAALSCLSVGIVLHGPARRMTDQPPCCAASVAGLPRPATGQAKASLA